MAIYHKLLNSIDMEKLKILNLNFSFQRAAHYHINGGMLLMGVVLLAMFRGGIFMPPFGITRCIFR